MECYILDITDITKDGEPMVLEIDFNSDEALYIQLRNQIIVGIATERIREGDSLPSVRQLAEHIGINMHIKAGRACEAGSQKGRCYLP